MAAVIGGGCAPQKAPAPTAVAGAGVALADPVCRAERVVMLKDVEAVFVANGGGGRMMLRTQASAAEGEWSVARATAGSEAERAVRTELLHVQDGAVVMARTIDHGEKVETVFEPALVVMPRELARGESASQDVRMTVHPEGERSKRRAAGTARNEIVYVGDETMEVGGKQVAARHVRGVFTADLSGTKVRNVTDQWFVDGEGLVAETRSERTLLMGLPVRQSEESWVRER